jgi:three-Cys-motif partner protein
VSGPIDEVGPWTEVKVEIVQEYAAGFAKIISKIGYFQPVYIDGFAGGGLLLSETTGEIVEGTPLKIVRLTPPFHEYHFVEKDSSKVAALRALVGSEPGVSIHSGDSNEILLGEILPSMTYASYRKGLLFLDPYGLDIDWRVIEAAGRSRCIDLLLNFPIMDMNMNILKTDPSRTAPDQAARMDRFWGDDDWKKDCYEEQPGLFGMLPPRKKPGNEPAVLAYQKRLKEAAGFSYVSTALPMRNEKNAIVYYLIGASHARVAVKVFIDVFAKWRKRGGRIG